MVFGRPVTLKQKRRHNGFLVDETGDNTHGKQNSKQSGEKKAAPRGKVPKEEVEVNEAHFTLTPFNDFSGNLRFVVLIFAGEKMNQLSPMGVDIFAESGSTNKFNNFGPGKRHPGMSLYNSHDREVPVLFVVTPNASMNGSMLLQAFKEMDRLDVTERGIDENGKEY